MSSMSRSEYIAKWGQTHGGYDANASLLARTWLGFAYTFTRPLIAMRLTPNAITFLGLVILPDQIAKNEKLADVQAVQAASSDGWLAITLEQRKAPPPTIASPPRPKQNRPAEARRKTVWR